MGFYPSARRKDKNELKPVTIRREIPGWPGFVITIDGIVYRMSSGNVFHRVQHINARKKLPYVKLVVLDGVKIPVWKLMYVAFGSGNPDVVDITYNDFNYRNCTLSNLCFFYKDGGNSFLRIKEPTNHKKR